jgi:hypothetical protein
MEAQMDYAETERRLVELLTQTKHMLPARHLDDVAEFLDVGEHALVLETIAGGVAGQQLDPKIVQQIKELAEVLGLTEGVSYQMFWRCLPQLERT